MQTLEHDQSSDRVKNITRIITAACAGVTAIAAVTVAAVFLTSNSAPAADAPQPAIVQTVEAAPEAPVEVATPEPTATVEAEATEQVTEAPAAVTGAVTQAEAEAIALAHIGEGRVTWVEREDDHGAAWEIEITRPNGREVDVYVAADGTVLRTR